MRILHTADLHLGRQFNGIALEDDHAAVLDQIVAALLAHDADVLVIAGDIFDRAAPPERAVRQFNGFLGRVARESGAAVVMIAGNHDSAERIATMSIMTDSRRALIAGVASADPAPLIVGDDAGPVAFSALPFAYEYAARETFADPTIANPEDVLAAQVAAARARVPEGARWVVVAHAFVAGGSGSEGERSLARVGGVETVRPDVFAGAHYVALGHLHRPQSVGAPHIRYAGAPLAFGFDEAGGAKSMSLVDLAGDGSIRVTEIPFAPPRAVRVVRGALLDLLESEKSDDFVRAELTDDAPPIEPMKRLRAVFPNACQLAFVREARQGVAADLAGARSRLADPITVIDDFLAFVRERGLDAPERDLVATTLAGFGEEDRP